MQSKGKRTIAVGYRHFWLLACSTMIGACNGEADRSTSNVADHAAASVPANEVTHGIADASGRMQALLDEIAEIVPGVSAAVATSDGVVWSGTAGWSDIENKQAVNPEQLFGIGSITKTFTSVVLQQLADEDQLDLGAPLASILGEEVDGIANADTATVRQLMNHTSGIPSWEDDATWKREGRGADLNPDHVWGKTETLRYIEGQPALFAPGTQYSYSNSNFTLLGRVVEVVTGKDLVEVIAARIRGPVGIDSIFLEGFEPIPANRHAARYHFNTADFRRDAGINTAFVPVDDKLINVAATNLSVEWAAGGMVAAAGDLARYGVAVFDGTLLSEQAIADLTTFRPVREARADDTAPVAETGYGIFRRYLGEHQVLGHGGDVLGYAGWLYYEPNSGVAM
ncbi:MAG: serine hydrolase domain-containing protein, partial [Woeseia sp.]